MDRKVRSHRTRSAVGRGPTRLNEDSARRVCVRVNAPRTAVLALVAREADLRTTGREKSRTKATTSSEAQSHVQVRLLALIER